MAFFAGVSLHPIDSHSVLSYRGYKLTPYFLMSFKWGQVPFLSPLSFGVCGIHLKAADPTAREKVVRRSKGEGEKELEVLETPRFFSLSFYVCLIQALLEEQSF